MPSLAAHRFQNCRWPRPTRAEPGPLAVVLLHGYLCLSPAIYWRGLRPVWQVLLACGLPVVAATAPRTGGVAARAERIAARLARLPQRRLVLVGHSMGGLDARWLASRLDPERRIARVVTLGTPHRGTPAAEWALRGRRWPAPLLRLLDRGALRDLTRDGARALDRAMPDRGDVSYRALAGRLPGVGLAHPIADVAALVSAEEGANDGVVPVTSARRWHDPLAVPAHHLGLIGQPMRGAPGPGGMTGALPPAALARLLLGELAGPERQGASAAGGYPRPSGASPDVSPGAGASP